MPNTRRKAAERYITLSAKLIAPTLDTHPSLGYDWIIDTIKLSPHAEIGNELEIAKAIQFLKTKDFQKAVETLKAFEKKDTGWRMVGTAATNLSFMYFLEGDWKGAEKYADLAIGKDRYNAKALTNRGNCLFVKGEGLVGGGLRLKSEKVAILVLTFTFDRPGNYEKAREHYEEAVSVDAVCTEAMYNLGKSWRDASPIPLESIRNPTNVLIGLVHRKLGNTPQALTWFEKLHGILRNSAEVIYQIANM